MDKGVSEHFFFSLSLFRKSACSSDIYMLMMQSTDCHVGIVLFYVLRNIQLFCFFLLLPLTPCAVVAIWGIMACQREEDIFT